MAGRKGFVRVLGRVAREIERANRRAQRAELAAAREQRRAAQEVARLRREEERAVAKSERERQLVHRQAREAHVEELNASLELQLAELDTLLDTSVGLKHYIDLASLRTAGRDQAVAEFAAALAADKPEAVAEYFEMVLAASPYPDGFPSHRRLAYVPESRQLVIELDYPSRDIVPAVKSYRYIRARDEIRPTQRSNREINAVYKKAIAEITIRTIYEVFDADRRRWIDVVVLNGHVRTIDPVTGKSIHPCLISLRATFDVFNELEVDRVDPVACLRGLHAQVSRSPAELSPVRPVLEFSMVDPRYVEETDVISELDSRVNLMELSPLEFEGLISNLFECMGLDTRQTRPSRDGGVDCVAYDNRPILGGKVVIQAKRYKNTVGVSAVRDLFGTLQNEGASKGILVTTSGFGKSSFEFAEGKPIELLDGSNLLYLLAEHAGLEAKIEVPDDWTDPSPDQGDPPGE